MLIKLKDLLRKSDAASVDSIAPQFRSIIQSLVRDTPSHKINKGVMTPVDLAVYTRMMTFLHKELQTCDLLDGALMVLAQAHQLITCPTDIKLSVRPSKEGRVLTHREIEVMRHTAEGLSNRAVARILKISQRTVETHLERARHKIGANNTVELIRFAIRSGIIPLDQSPLYVPLSPMPAESTPAAQAA